MTRADRLLAGLFIAPFVVIWLGSMAFALSGDPGAWSAAVGIPVGAAYFGLVMLVARRLAR